MGKIVFTVKWSLKPIRQEDSIMNKMSIARVAGAILMSGWGLLAGTQASAGTTSGTISVTLNITSACVVNGAAALQANAGSVGTIQFPDQPGIFASADGQLVGSLGTLQVLCSPGVTPALTVGSGANDAAGKRYLASGGNSVAYKLFTDSGRTNEITIGQQLSLGTATTSAINVPIFARVSSGGAVLAAGSYADTVQVVLSW